MDSTIISVIVGVAGLVVGVIAGKFIFAKDTKHKIDEAEAQAGKIVSDAQAKAETIKQQKQLEAKERFLQLKSDHEKEVLDRNRKIGESENRIKQREMTITQKETGLDKQIKE
ncbi:MAG TPA: Rnase Y domain-containing protein, partial [Chitinophagaceae bacterium]|nr:Rnase Y domain-containing protein [Chitinophagaceae bacterium]